MLEQISANKRRSAAFVLVFGGLVALVVWAVGTLVGDGLVSVVVAVVVAAAGVVAVYRKSDGVALALSHAVPADPARFARLHNLVEGLCVAAGLPKPRVYVIDDAAPNAFATGRSPKHAAIACTTGLVDKLNRIELEGVLAHELSHVKSYDILASTLAVTLVGLPGLALLPFGTARTRLMQLAVDRRHESLADLGGVALTRYPPGLVSALEKLRADHGSVAAGSRATDHLWIDSPLGDDVDERLDVLRSL